MALQPVNSRPVQAVTPDQRTPGQHTLGQHLPAQQQQQLSTQKKSQAVAILEATIATISSKDDPLALVLRTAIEKINELLAPELGSDAIQSAVDTGLDVSPEATAERIVNLSTAFFSAFREQHAEESDEEALSGFLSTIREGIDQGFSEAREILDGLQVLGGDIATNIDSTYELVLEKLQAFEDSFNTA